MDASGAAAEAVGYMLKSMRPTEADERAEPGAEATKERREAEQTEQDPVAEQRVPNPLGLSAWEDSPTGVLARLQAKLSQDGAEAYIAVEELRRFVTAQIRREIRALMKTIDARFSIHDAKIERKNAAPERQTVDIKALTNAVQDLRVIVAVQNAKLDSLRWMLGIAILLLMAWVAMEISNYSFPRFPVNSPSRVSESAPPAPVAAPAAPQGGATGSVPTGPAAGTAETLRQESAPAHRTEP